MEHKIIEALPLIDHIQRYSDALTAGYIGTQEFAFYSETALKALLKPFVPEDVPLMLEGWHCCPANDNSFCMIGSVPDIDYMEVYAERNWLEYNSDGGSVYPKSINKFLKYLQDNEITAHFKSEWVKEMGMK